MDAGLLELKNKVLGLPMEQRVFLAQALWSSFDACEAPEALDAVDEAVRRDEEMRSGRVSGRSHDEVMAAMAKRLK
ncbi:addiction module protein [Acanthopleuribacter pedis]|uniref:Addiction module protein n=1 Tax=Acanthopleuribacter pedis TaxID=442870 RepID=A0A8J7Q7G9_9BACT|nr:addiction module protein [Acanthopleuribacter pedis]MBO1322102.1 addiction module protein [Acanthopleuribacter pedis]